jgi:isocitrate lyase
MREPTRPYTTEDVERLRGSVRVEHTLARLGAERLRALLEEREWVAALGALTGGQAVQMVKAGLEAIYLSGWQVAADANLVGGTYPDQSLYPANSGPALARRINNALLRADQIAHAEGDDETYWLAPIVADAEAGFGGPLNAFELMKAYIGARRPCTSRTSSRPRRNAATSAGRSWSRRASSCGRSSQHGSRPTCSTCRP